MKPKTIKLKAVELKEANKLLRDATIAYHGIEVAQKIHFEVGERLWEMLRDMYPEVVDTKAKYNEGVITYTPKYPSLKEEIT